MNISILGLSHFLHIIGTVVWIGGILMMLFVILPGAKAGLESQSVIGKLMNEVAKRFTPLANISIFLVIITGIILMYYNKNFTSFIDFNGRWNIVIFIKHVFVAIMVFIHFYRGFILNPKIGKIPSGSNGAQVLRLKKISLNLVKINFALGILVLLLTAISISI